MIISNDPGRSNIMFTVALDMNGRLIYIKGLTRRHYYHALKIDSHNKLVLKWNKSIQDLYLSLSQQHFKTMSPEEYLQSIENYSTQYDAIWKRMGGSRKWMHGKLYLCKHFILSRSSTGIQLLPRRERSCTKSKEARHIMITMSCCMVQEIFHQEPRV